MFSEVSGSHYDKYMAEMAKGVQEKLFFLNEVPKGAYLLDFGCADGFLMNEIHRARPDIVLAGLDLSEEALHSTYEKSSDFLLFKKTSDASKWIKDIEGPTVFFASSVLHEVCHYGGNTAWEDFWELASEFQHFAFRDFSISEQEGLESNELFVKDVKAKLPSWQVQSYEKIWGKIKTNKDALHLLLKAPWISSWERESEENYFPIFRQELTDTVSSIFKRGIIKPHRHAYSNTRSHSDFGIEIPTNTHIQIFASKG